MPIVLHWLVSTIAILVTAYILPGIEVAGFGAAFVTALVLGLVNAILRPVLFILTLPINIVSLGLFTLVINAFLILLTDKIVPGFSVSSFWWAVLFSIVLFLVNGTLHGLAKGESKQN